MRLTASRRRPHMLSLLVIPRPWPQKGRRHCACLCSCPAAGSPGFFHQRQLAMVSRRTTMMASAAIVLACAVASCAAAAPPSSPGLLAAGTLARGSIGLEGLLSTSPMYRDSKVRYRSPFTAAFFCMMFLLGRGFCLLRSILPPLSPPRVYIPNPVDAFLGLRIKHPDRCFSSTMLFPFPHKHGFGRSIKCDGSLSLSLSLSLSPPPDLHPVSSCGSSITLPSTARWGLWESI